VAHWAHKKQAPGDLSRSEQGHYDDGMHLARDMLTHAALAAPNLEATGAANHVAQIEQDDALQKRAKLDQQAMEEAAVQAKEAARLKAEEASLISGSESLRRQESNPEGNKPQLQYAPVADVEQQNAKTLNWKYALHQAALDAESYNPMPNMQPVSSLTKRKQAIDSEAKELQDENRELGAEQGEEIKQIAGAVQGAAALTGSVPGLAKLHAHNEKSEAMIQKLREKVAALEGHIAKVKGLAPPPPGQLETDSESKTSILDSAEGSQMLTKLENQVSSLGNKVKGVQGTDDVEKAALEAQAKIAADGLAAERAKLSALEAASHAKKSPDGLTPLEKILQRKVTALETRVKEMHENEKAKVAEDEGKHDREQEARIEVLEARISRMAHRNAEKSHHVQASADARLRALSQTLQTDIDGEPSVDLPRNFHQMAKVTRQHHLLKVKAAIEKELSSQATQP